MVLVRVKAQGLLQVNLSLTCVDGPSHEERSIFLQVPAVTRSVHPGDLKNPLLLQVVDMVSTCTRTSVCTCVCKRAHTYFVDPLQARDLTGVDLFLQPRPHPHPLYGHVVLPTHRGQLTSHPHLRLGAHLPDSSLTNFIQL